MRRRNQTLNFGILETFNYQTSLNYARAISHFLPLSYPSGLNGIAGTFLTKRLELTRSEPIPLRQFLLFRFKH